MTPAMATYIGLVIAALILVWGVVEIGRKYFLRKKPDASVMNSWVPLDPSSDVRPVDEEANGQDKHSDSGIQTRAHQNGHYSGSKKSL
ncbi:hypothetical protein EPA93_40390 [Ktedonosporobacter rubrisoli]|uniref:Uncharacterized protein n=1 Tax=Ktedonosporobacter rubrisoli TaxID=2509675 RepID=A0A4P6K1F1_KTERU|nr:hypothetical protein [Ktedonosporobacter rubrisoli]QBD81904.1 hypothetical protein EPA93_40390 [Ktedonosporobacter rubrisoli]